MFDKFGEFDSVEELNEAAAGQLEQGDVEALKELAAENGIDEEDVVDYIDGVTKELASASMAAYGRLAVEEKNVKTNKGEEMVARVLFQAARSLCLRPSFCVAVMRKGKRLMDVYKIMRETAKKNKTGSVGVACGTDKELNNIIMAYYMLGESEAEKVIMNLYS